ncbi:predicted protein [Nematostella vectensis]|uniref:CHY-type domain-containing protein n=1 Tax=Nematostella vectensis TaxID=45351 RepID=A7SW13_NEMVE|nr:predicted protein [Nematostella vectensis]|eukprot:XP_001624199.1 predicted protein [Nematostella vectensis]
MVEKPKRQPKTPGLKEGFPLPENGTCKHYKKSYRWLRFPCCGKCYPCDVCHEESENHEMVFASRMVCGYCSKEQNPCVACKSSMTRAKSAHWEGGKGCRDKTVMDRFPCCGKCYPCDVCHEESENHEMVFASRMVCGYCSKEQFFSQNPCVACKSSMTRAKSAHWEGGKGCRDKTVMDRGDEKKYKNLTKTTSRKAENKNPKTKNKK